ncbi:tripartite ATP-independent transporter DctP family solute receptor [Geomicrobium halophilum]|uniref:Tripartite ATP-independent transporter DctP family solute receptor n=1 Tax=Geomicrobium halophilum TaxID=549000 RepID=A0A841PIE0_9BACL|nr:TRAP transporter substrate-binding protein [Geomicrobium halophilum]MBB6448647.1 tripartite ATP-independent transporter DctP family solute receptor [Geomicrobium halophilum]
MLRKWLSYGMVVSMVGLVACGEGEESASSEVGGEGEQTIKVAHYFAQDHPQNVALNEKFKPLVEENSNGSLTVEIYPDSQLGAEEEFYAGVQSGTTEMGVPGMIMQDEVEKIAVAEWPFLFEDYDHVQNVLNGEIGDELTEDLEDIHGVKALSWSANGFRMLSSNQTIESMEDLNGLRVRTPNIPNYIELWERMGTTVSPLPIDEIFTSLEQGVVDAQENPVASVRASGWYEVQSDILESRHMFSPNMYVINAQFYDGLSEEEQQIVEEAAIESAEYQFELMENSYEEDKEYLESEGVNFTNPSEEFQEQMIDAAEPMYEDFYAEFDWAEDIVQRIEEEAE